MRRPVRRQLAPLLLLLVATLGSCGREPMGPGAGRVSAPLALAPRLPAAARAADGASLVAFDRVRLVLRRSDGSVALDRESDFPSTADSIALTLTVPLGPSATEAGEALSLTLRLIDAAGDTVFRGGPSPVFAAARGGTVTEPVVVPLTYTGPGASATRVVVSPTFATLVAGAQQAFTTQAFDAQNTLLPGTPVRFRSLDTSVVTITDAGVATARAVRGSALIVAELYTGPSDSVPVAVILPASRIQIVSGNAQTGVAGAALAQPVVARVLAADDVPVANVRVDFTAGQGGQVSLSPVFSNASGDVVTTWQLGPGAGAQTLVASAVGLTGSPLTFTATATAGAATQLAFSVAPTTATAGLPIAPAVVVEARTAGGLLATGFTDSVTVAFSTNVVGGTLAGTRTVAAVGGVATFAGLSIDIAGGGYSLVATSGALTPATTAAFTVLPGAATALAWLQQPAGGVPGVALLPSPSVRAVDAFGNTATGYAGTITIAIGANPGGSTLGGTTSVAAVSGIATFPGLVLGVAGSGYTLVASAAGLGGATSAPFTLGAAVNSWTNAAGGFWSVATNWSLGHAPTAAEIAEVVLPGTYGISLDVDPTVAELRIGTGASGTQTLSTSGARTLTVVDGMTIGPRGAVVLGVSTLAGTGTVVVDGALTLYSSTIAPALALRGTMSVSGNSALTGALSTTAAALLRIGQADGCCGTATFTVANGFTNAGTIELTNLYTIGYAARLVVTAGILVNAPGGTIAALGGQTPGGARTLTAALENRGALLVRVPLLVDRASAPHTNDGVIDADSASLTIAAAASLTNRGQVRIGTGMTVAMSGGILSQEGTLVGDGTLALTAVSFALSVPFTNAVTALTLSSSTVVGPAALTNAAGRTLTLVSSSVQAPFANEGLLVASGASSITAAFANVAGAVLRVGQVDGCCGTANLTIASGFSNFGTIELSNAFTVAYAARLAVTSGALVNQPGATIAALGGQTPGGTRTLTALLDNRGDLVARVPLTIDAAGVAHQNTGTIDSDSANITLTLPGGSSFTNSGVIRVASGRTLLVNQGTFTHAGSFVGTGGFSLGGTTLVLDQPLSTATTAVSLQNLTVTGPATLTNAAGRNSQFLNTTIATPFVNAGTMVVSGTSAFNGPVSNLPGATLRVAQLDGCCGTAALTVADGFINEGLIELSNQFTIAYAATLNVTNGTLVNAPGATLAAIGGQTPGGARTLGAMLDNEGTLDVQVPLTISRPSSQHTNNGQITLTTGSLTVTQTGTAPSFVNTGSMDIAVGRLVTLTGGTFVNDTDGLVQGAGALSLSNVVAQFPGGLPGVASWAMTNSTVTVNEPLSTAAISLLVVGSTLNGTGSLEVAAGTTLALSNSTVTLPVAVDGTLTASGTVNLSGALTTTPTSLIRVAQSDGSTGTAHLTVANGFTNLGAIELANDYTVAYNAQLTVSSGTLVNAPGASLAGLGGQTPGGTRTLTLALDNQGTVTAAVPMTLSRASAIHDNTGTIALTTGDFTVSQSGAGAEFAHAGDITIGAGRTFTVSGGTLSSQAGGTYTGGTLALQAVTASFTGLAPDVTALVATASTLAINDALDTDLISLSLVDSRVTGTGSITNAAGRTLQLYRTRLAVPLFNAGTLIATATDSLLAPLTTAPGSIIRIGQVDGAASLANLVVSAGFTNDGAIELTNNGPAGYDARLSLLTGTLVNSSSGTITTSAGTVGGGTRTIGGSVDNQGSITVAPGAAGLLAITGNLTSNGVLNLELGGTAAGTGYDRIAVSGTAALNGTLNVAIINGFSPPLLTGFQVITYASGSGLLSILPPLGFTFLQGLTSVTVTSP